MARSARRAVPQPTSTASDRRRQASTPMPIAPPEVWSRLRTTRAARPGNAAATDGRRRTYGAAMEQFEELMRAAEQVGAATRPLLLYYALSQGRTSRGRGPRWRTL